MLADRRSRVGSVVPRHLLTPLTLALCAAIAPACTPLAPGSDTRDGGGTLPGEDAPIDARADLELGICRDRPGGTTASLDVDGEGGHPPFDVFCNNDREYLALGLQDSTHNISIFRGGATPCACPEWGSRSFDAVRIAFHDADTPYLVTNDVSPSTTYSWSTADCDAMAGDCEPLGLLNFGLTGGCTSSPLGEGNIDLTLTPFEISPAAELVPQGTPPGTGGVLTSGPSFVNFNGGGGSCAFFGIAGAVSEAGVPGQPASLPLAWR